MEVREVPWEGQLFWPGFFLLITDIRHPLERFDIHTRLVHQPVKQLERPVVRLFHAIGAGIPKGALDGTWRFVKFC